MPSQNLDIFWNIFTNEDHCVRRRVLLGMQLQLQNQNTKEGVYKSQPDIYYDC